jgi:dTDP-4-dehydrorhamnose 3,5-epimerase
MFPGAISAWHTHAITTDRLFVAAGVAHIVLYDAREDSPTKGLINEFRYGEHRQALVSVPPGVWHGVRNFGPSNAVLLNLVDVAYQYDDPDHWRLPIDTDKIPFKFDTSNTRDALLR